MCVGPSQNNHDYIGIEIIFLMLCQLMIKSVKSFDKKFNCPYLFIIFYNEQSMSSNFKQRAQILKKTIQETAQNQT